MPVPALNGSYPLPGMPGATLVVGRQHTRPAILHLFRNGPVHLACDIETFGVGADAGPGRIKCVTFADEHTAVILDPRDPHDRDLIFWVLAHALTLTFHNAPFDVPSLAINRLFRREWVDKVFDTILWARMATPGLKPGKSLDECTERYLGIKNEPILKLFKALGYKSKLEGFLNLDIDSVAYLFGAGADAIATARLAPILYKAAIDRQLDHPFGPTIGLSRTEAQEMAGYRQEHNRWGIEETIDGMAVDFGYLEWFRGQNQAEMDRRRAYLKSLGIENANQLVAFLDQIGALPPDYPMTKGGKLGLNPKLSTAAESLQDLRHPLAEVWAGVEAGGKVIKQGLTHLEKLDGYLQKCVDMADANGRIHPTTAVLKAAHGRDSMSDPPIHQFPELARPIICFDEDHTSTDWSQQEPRIAMNLAGDVGPPLLDYERYGTKIYKGIAEFAEIDLDVAKVVVLESLYGSGIKAISEHLGLDPGPWLPQEVWSNGRVMEAHWGYEAAKDVYQAVFSAIPYVERFMKQGKQIARDHQVAYTVAGRIVPIPSSFFMGKYGPQAHKWINYCVSGSANDEISWTIVQARRAGFGHLVKFGMHDELVHASSVAREVKQLMETPSERFCRLAGRRPVIRTDSAPLGRSWKKV